MVWIEQPSVSEDLGTPKGSADGSATSSTVVHEVIPSEPAPTITEQPAEPVKSDPPVVEAVVPAEQPQETPTPAPEVGNRPVAENTPADTNAQPADGVNSMQQSTKAQSPPRSVRWADDGDCVERVEAAAEAVPPAVEPSTPTKQASADAELDEIEKRMKESNREALELVDKISQLSASSDPSESRPKVERPAPVPQPAVGSAQGAGEKPLANG